MPGVCLCHKEIDRFPSSSTAPKSEILVMMWGALVTFAGIWLYGYAAQSFEKKGVCHNRS